MSDILTREEAMREKTALSLMPLRLLDAERARLGELNRRLSTPTLEEVSFDIWTRAGFEEEHDLPENHPMAIKGVPGKVLRTEISADEEIFCLVWRLPRDTPARPAIYDRLAEAMGL